jgi:hypothetical protein
MTLPSALRLASILSRLDSAKTAPHVTSRAEPHTERGLDPKIGRQVMAPPEDAKLATSLMSWFVRKWI